jgi:hypothetical protein
VELLALVSFLVLVAAWIALPVRRPVIEIEEKKAA